MKTRNRIFSSLAAALSLPVTFRGRLLPNAVRKLVAMAGLGLAVSSTPALAQVWQASTDYSVAQGYRNWRYMTYLPGIAGAQGTYEPMVYGVNTYGFDSWHTVPYNGDYIAWSGMHPAPGVLVQRECPKRVEGLSYSQSGLMVG